MSITWNGVSSDTIGVIVERIPNRYVPTRRFSPQQVAGRNGNILLVDKAFPNVEQEYEVYLSAEAQGLPSVARACAEWLMGPDGYCRLTDSYDTTVYREAFLMGGYDLENILNKFGRCTITFSCKPQKYLLAGDTPIEIPAGITTYTGDVVQFDVITGASITSLSTTITPIQDLHGYDSPWPAGGGKNKLPPLAGILNYKSLNSGWTWNDNVATLNGITLEVIQKDGIPTGEYKITGTATANTNFYLLRADATPYAGMIMNGIPAGTVSRWEMYCALQVSPYTSWGYDTGNGVTLNSSASGMSLIILRLKNNGHFDDVFTPMLRLATEADATFAPYSNICPISGRTGVDVYVGPTQDQQDATTYAVDWTTEAGTVYGGTVDPVAGQLTINGILKVFNGNESFVGTYWPTVVCNTALSYVGDYKHLSEMRCSHCETGSRGAGFANQSADKIQFKHADEVFSVNNATEFATYVAMQYANGTPVTVYYPLATPLTYQLTAQEIEVLVGENNVWTSSGPVSVTVEAPFVGIVTNPTPFEARPLLTVSGVGEITINGKSIQILESVSDFEIDCETMEAEDNSKIYCMDFPELSGGENEIVGDGSITALTVTPRWWTL